MLIANLNIILYNDYLFISDYMKTSCSNCDQRLDIPEELSGQTIECPACSGSITLPTSDLSAPEQNETDIDRTTEIPNLKSKIKSKPSPKPSRSPKIKKIKPVSRMINESVKEDRSLYKVLFKKKALIMISCLSLFALIFWDSGIGLLPLLIIGWAAYKYMFPDSTGLETSSVNIGLSKHDNKIPKWLFAIIAGLITFGLLIILLSGPTESYSLTIPNSKKNDLVLTFNLHSDGSVFIKAKGEPGVRYKGQEGSWKLQGSNMNIESLSGVGLLIKFDKNTLKLKSVNIGDSSVSVKRLKLERN